MTAVTLFIVRVWRRDGFHASVRRVDDEEVRLFETSGAVARYLETSTASDADPAAKVSSAKGGER